MTVKKFFVFFMLCLTVLMPVLSLASCGEGEKIVLNVYNWGEYISDGSEDSLDVNAA